MGGHVQDLDIYRAAKLTIEQHGARALLVAMENIEIFRASNNNGGMNAWSKIADAIEWMQMPENLRGDTQH
jgi:hypothetical protein